MVFYGRLHCARGHDYDSVITSGTDTYLCPTCGLSHSRTFDFDANNYEFDCPICGKTHIDEVDFWHFTIMKMCNFCESQNSMYAAAVL